MLGGRGGVVCTCLLVTNYCMGKNNDGVIRRDDTTSACCWAYVWSGGRGGSVRGIGILGLSRMGSLGIGFRIRTRV